MSSATLSRVAIALWGVTLVGGGTGWLLCASGKVEPVVQAEDSRETIEVEPGEHDVLRQVMQANLVTFQGLAEACAREDSAAAGALARAAAEAPGVGRAAPTLRPDLPKQWRAWGKTIHREYSRFAASVEAGEAGCGDLSATLSAVTASCISCHSTYRVVPAPAL